MTSPTIFIYGLVAHGTTPLADYSEVEGNFQEISIKMLEMLDERIPMATADQGQYVFDTLTEADRITFLCISYRCSNASQIQRNNFLNELRQKWRQKYGNSGSTFSANSKTIEFSSIIMKLMQSHNNEENDKRTIQVKKNLLEEEERVVQDLSVRFQRVEQIDMSLSKGANGNESNERFQKVAKEVRRRMCWQKYRLWVLIGVIAIFIMFVIVTLACGGFTYKRCTNSGDDE